MVFFMRNWNYSRSLAAILLSSALSLSGCGLVVVNDMSDTPGNPQTGHGETESYTVDTATPFTKYIPTEDSAAIGEAYVAALPQLTFDGAAFFITSPTFSYLYPDELGTTVSQLAYTRNQKLEEIYDVSIITAQSDAGVMLEEVKKAVASGSYYSDFMMVPLYQLGAFKAAGVLFNLRSLPYLDMTKPYFYQESVSASSAGYNTWAIAGQASVEPGDFSAVYVNRDAIENAGMDTPYRLVRDGKWTWDALYTYVAGITDITYSVTAQNTASRLPDLLYTSMGNRFVLSGEKIIPIVHFTEDSAKKTIETGRKLLTDPKAITDSSAGAAGCFSRGESLFLIDYLYVAPWLTNAACDWGIVPLPKGEEKGSYRTLVANTTLLFTIPLNTTNGEMDSVLLSAINALSYGTLYDAYVENSMYHVLRDNASVDMLDRILDTASFDFALAFGSAYPTIGKGTYQLIRSAMTATENPSGFADAVSNANMILAEYFGMENEE